MFKIIDYRNSSGKILITIESDDFTAALFLRFMSEADKFAEIFHYRQRIEKNVALIQKGKHERMAHARQIRAELLKMYKEISGSRRQRLKILYEMCLLEGMEITQDRLITKLQIAMEEEKIHKQTLIKVLIRKGK